VIVVHSGSEKKDMNNTWLTKKLVPPDYQPVFESTKLPQQVPVVENKLNYGETSHDEQVKQLREIVKLLKCVLLV
jgi:hypothetical protein